MIRLEIDLSGDRAEIDVLTIATTLTAAVNDKLRGTRTVIHRVTVEEVDA